MSSTAPRLPPELEFAVFSEAAKVSRQVHYTLLLVARRVCLWLEPLLYRTLFFGHEYRSPELSTMSLPRQSFLVVTVRHIVVCGNPPGAPLRLFSAVPHIAIGGPYRARDMRDAFFALTNLRSLATDPRIIADGCLTTADAVRPVFAVLTHLELFRRPPGVAEFCAALPCLTHVALNEDIDSWDDAEPVIDAILTKSTKLILLVVLEEPDELPLADCVSESLSDPRLVITTSVDWAEGALDMWSYWDAAREFLQGKANGLIAADQFRAWRC
ncbi:hypothetical protein MIND_01335500 [Mycena indigotica]|uniref:Uncharacterized protein n=1 Tax=Mycena indigotica TaxID=2126181 RepID=A0A8H6S0Y6_9AGAR|nr:uncharacterized protein MIND_01335500 [Mycena indigotica]KAF7290220.1 hypothetical protein MIND_01335500 [Mycena indigotica]